MGKKETLAVICLRIAWISAWISFSVFSGFGFEGDDNDGVVDVEIEYESCPANGRENGSIVVAVPVVEV
jgi:hypothetical protein